MKLINERIGFATNSSSSHSIIICDENVAKEINDDIEYEGSFGWNYFTIKSSYEKLKYISICFVDSLINDFCEAYDKENAYHLMNNMTDELLKIAFSYYHYYFNPFKEIIVKGMSFQQEDFINNNIDMQYDLILYIFFKQCLEDWSVDHDGRSDLGLYAKAYPQDAIKYIKQILDDNVLILGGNDNDDYVHPLYNIGLKLDRLNVRHFDVMEFDKENNNFILFNPSDGNRLVFSVTAQFFYTKENKIEENNTPEIKVENVEVFDRVLSDEEVKQKYQESIVKTSFPLLTDISITDNCEYYCDYCYRGCNFEGEHADFIEIVKVLKELKDIGCLEVAIGGGNPLLHPNLFSILNYCKEINLVANLSLNFDEEVFCNRKLIKQLLKLVGQIGVSCRNLKSVKNLIEIINREGFDINKFKIHIVLGVIDTEEIKKVLLLCNKNKIAVLLLGFKNTGRAKSYLPDETDQWHLIVKKLMKKNKIHQLGVDTKIIQDYENEIKELGIPETLYNSEEGKMNCFIDMVKKTIAPSSYSDDDFKFENPKDILTLYNKEF